MMRNFFVLKQRAGQAQRLNYLLKNVLPRALYLLRRLLTYRPSRRNSPTLARIAGSAGSSSISRARAAAAGKALDGFHVGDEFLGGEIVAGGEGEVALELLGDAFVGIGVAVAGEDCFDGFADEGADQLVLGAFFFGEGHFDFSAATGDQVIQIADARDDAFFAGCECHAVRRC